MTCDLHWQVQLFRVMLLLLLGTHALKQHCERVRSYVSFPIFIFVYSERMIATTDVYMCIVVWHYTKTADSFQYAYKICSFVISLVSLSYENLTLSPTHACYPKCALSL